MNLILKILAHSIILIAFTGTLSACRKNISGQVFVVTKGRENVKIGLAPIYFLSNTEFQSVAKETIALIEKDEQAISQRRRDFMALGALAEEISTMVEEVNKINPSDSVGHINNTLRLMKHVLPVEELLYEIYPEGIPDGSDRFPIYRERMLGSVEKITKVDSPATPIKTDSDGRFEIKIRANGWIVSYAERKIADETELYLWVNPVDLRSQRENGPVLLSNESNSNSTDALYEAISHALGVTRNLDQVREGAVTPKIAQLVVKAQADVEKEAEILSNEIRKALSSKGK